MCLISRKLNRDAQRTPKNYVSHFISLEGVIQVNHRLAIFFGSGIDDLLKSIKRLSKE